MGTGKPYIDTELKSGCIIREFGDDIDPIELMWHRDNEDRLVEVIDCGEGWMFQFDNELPIKLCNNKSLSIKRHDWHRVIKGDGKLLVRINKFTT